MSESLRVNLLASETFDLKSTPLIMGALAARGHIITVIPEMVAGKTTGLLDCDVFLDRSAIIDIDFFSRLNEEISTRRNSGNKIPLMVDPPPATIDSMDKRNTHALFPRLIPETYELDGHNNTDLIGRFACDELVVIKDPFSWHARNIDLLTPEEAAEKYRDTTCRIVQKYVPYVEGVGRLLTINHPSGFEILSAYNRIPNSWRTGHGTVSRCVEVDLTPDLYDFAELVSVGAGLFLNGIDYIEDGKQRFLLEVNSVPGIYTPYYEFGVDVPARLVERIEDSYQYDLSS